MRRLEKLPVGPGCAGQVGVPLAQAFVKDTSLTPAPIAAVTLHGKPLALYTQGLGVVFTPFTVTVGIPSPAGTFSVTVPEVPTSNVPLTTWQ